MKSGMSPVAPLFNPNKPGGMFRSMQLPWIREKIVKSAKLKIPAKPRALTLLLRLTRSLVLPATMTQQFKRQEKPF
jgi:hypothetical protein